MTLADERLTTVTAHPCPICTHDRGEQPVICYHCTDRARGDLLALPGLVAAVEAELGLIRGAGTVRVSGSRERPLPGGVSTLSWLGPAADIHHALDCPACRRWSAYGPNLPCPDRDAQVGDEPVAAQLVGWVRVVAEESGWLPPAVGRTVAGRDGPVRRTTAADVPALVGWLAVRHDWACRQPWADDYAAELAEAHRSARRYAGVVDPPPQHMAGVWCPRCDAQAVYRRTGADGRRCTETAGGCGLWLSDEEYDRWVRLSAWFAKEAG